MIRALVAFKRRFPWAWNRVEWANGRFFRLRYRRIEPLAADILSRVDVAGCRFSLLEENDLPALESFLAGQDAESLTWFRPHAFDRKTLDRLFRNPSFIMMKVTAPDGSMAGYFFLRGFFIGRAFAGLLVDEPWRNRGIGTAIWAVCADICAQTGLRMQATISTENKPSVVSCKKGTDCRELQALEDHYLAVECQRKASPHA